MLLGRSRLGSSQFWISGLAYLWSRFYNGLFPFHALVVALTPKVRFSCIYNILNQGFVEGLSAIAVKNASIGRSGKEWRDTGVKVAGTVRRIAVG